MSQKFQVTLPVDILANDEIASLTEHVSLWTESLYGNANRALAGSTTSFITIGATPPAAPKLGEHWLDTSAAPFRLNNWNGSAWVAGTVTIGDTPPSGVGDGALWFDTNLSMIRVFATVAGITGFHPINVGYWLVTNTSGASFQEGDIVVTDPVGTGERDVVRTAQFKHMAVIGVAREAIVGGETGVIATVVGGLEVNVLMDPTETQGVTARGDGIVTFNGLGLGRTVGPLPTGGFLSADHGRSEGLPIGCFAVALGPRDVSNDFVRARMLGEVGRGARVWAPRWIIDATMTADGAWNEVDAGTGVVDAHKPILGVHVMANIATGNSSATTDISESFQLSVNQNAFHVTTLVGRGDSNGDMSRDVQQVFIPTSDGASLSYSALGEKFSYNLTNNGANAYSAAALYGMGYVY